MSDQFKKFDPDNFSLERQFRAYLKAVRLPEDQMSEIQKTETRRAFMAGCGQTVLLLEHEVSKLSDEDGVKALQRILDQVMEYFTGEIESQFGKKQKP